MKKGNLFFAAAAAVLLAAVSATQAQTWDCGVTEYGEDGSARPTSVRCVLGRDGTLRVSGRGAMQNYNEFDHYPTPPWREHGAITGVIIENGVTSIGDFAFSWSPRLTSVTIPNTVTSIGNAAFGRSGLTSVVIPNSVKTIGNWAFAQSTALRTVTIPGGVTDIAPSAFAGCANLQSVSLSGTGSTSLSLFAFLQELRNTMPRVTIDVGNVNVVAETVTWDCGPADNPGAVKATLRDGTLTISGNGAMTDEYSHPWHSLSHIITNVVVEDGVTTIGNNAFTSPRLTSITIGNSVNSVGYSAFACSPKLTTINSFNPVPPEIDTESDGGEGLFYSYDYDADDRCGPEDIANVCLYVPQNSIDAYRAANGWKQLSCIRALDETESQRIVQQRVVVDQQEIDSQQRPDEGEMDEEEQRRARLERLRQEVEEEKRIEAEQRGLTVEQWEEQQRIEREEEWRRRNEEVRQRNEELRRPENQEAGPWRRADKQDRTEMSYGTKVVLTMVGILAFLIVLNIATD